MIGPTTTLTGDDILYSPTPMKRRTGKTLKSSRRRSRDTMAKGAIDDSGKDMDNSRRSYQDSLSSSMLGTVATADIDSDSYSDSECNESFFGEDTVEGVNLDSTDITEATTLMENFESPKKVLNDDEQPKKRKKKKKKDKVDALKKTKKAKDKSDSPKKKKKNKDKSDTPKKKKKSKKKAKDKSLKSRDKGAKDRLSKGGSHLDELKEDSESIDNSDSDGSFCGEGFDDSHYVVPQIQRQEELQELPYGPPLWGDTEEEDSFGDAWQEDKSWNGWDEENDAEFVEETVYDDNSNDDGFSYYTIQSNEDLGFLDGDIDGLDIEDAESVSERTDTRRVRFNEVESIHHTLHICDFTKQEIRRSWYQQKDYEETIQGVREVASSSETPRDTQTRRRNQRSLLSKSAETRGLEAWTPSGVQRFRYVKEAAFRAVWDEQQKQIDQMDENQDNHSFDTGNVDTVRQAYLRVSVKSQKEAHERGKRDEEIAEKLRPRKGGLNSRFKKSLGSSARKLLDGNSNHDLSDSPIAPSSCIRKQDSIQEEDETEETSPVSRAWFGEARGLVRSKGDGSPKADRPARGLSKMTSERNLFSQKSDRGLFRQSSERGLFKKNTDRGLFKQSSDRGLFKKKSDRSLFRQNSDISLFKKKANFGPIQEEDESGDTEKTTSLRLFQRRKPTRRSSDSGLGVFLEKPDRGVARHTSARSVSSRRSSDGMIGSLFKKKSERGLTKQSSSRSLGLKKPARRSSDAGLGSFLKRSPDRNVGGQDACARSLGF